MIQELTELFSTYHSMTTDQSIVLIMRSPFTENVISVYISSSNTFWMCLTTALSWYAHIVMVQRTHCKAYTATLKQPYNITLYRHMLHEILVKSYHYSQPQLIVQQH